VHDAWCNKEQATTPRIGVLVAAAVCSRSRSNFCVDIFPRVYYNS